jgi:hypothetical protein
MDRFAARYSNVLDSASKPEFPIWTSPRVSYASSYPGHNEFVARAGPSECPYRKVDPSGIWGVQAALNLGFNGRELEQGGESCCVIASEA